MSFRRRNNAPLNNNNSNNNNSKTGTSGRVISQSPVRNYQSPTNIRSSEARAGGTSFSMEYMDDPIVDLQMTPADTPQVSPSYRRGGGNNSNNSNVQKIPGPVLSQQSFLPETPKRFLSDGVSPPASFSPSRRGAQPLSSQTVGTPILVSSGPTANLTPTKESAQHRSARPRAINGVGGGGGGDEREDDAPGNVPTSGIISPSIHSKKRSGLSSYRSICSTTASSETNMNRSHGLRVSLAHKALIGKGSYGMVFQAMDRDTNRIIAVKEISLAAAAAANRNVSHHNNNNNSNNNNASRSTSPVSPSPPDAQTPQQPSDEFKRQLDAVRSELALLKKLDHPNIVRCLGEECDDSFLRIYMEFVAGGSISSLVRKFGPLQERQASTFTHQMLLGLEYLHSKGIIHRDLKGDNLLVEPSGTLKLADFGTARDIRTATTACTHAIAGTANFIAPEVVLGNSITDVKSDIWSLGCCVIEMLTGSPPLSHLSNQYSIMMLIAESADNLADQYIPKDKESNWSAEVLDFVRTCLQKDAAKRPTAHQLLSHPWIMHPTQNDSIPIADTTVVATATPHFSRHSTDLIHLLGSPPSSLELKKEVRKKTREGKRRKGKSEIEASPLSWKLDSDGGYDMSYNRGSGIIDFNSSRKDRSTSRREADTEETALPGIHDHLPRMSQHSLMGKSSCNSARGCSVSDSARERDRNAILSRGSHVDFTGIMHQSSSGASKLYTALNDPTRESPTKKRSAKSMNYDYDDMFFDQQRENALRGSAQLPTPEHREKHVSARKR